MTIAVSSRLSSAKIVAEAELARFIDAAAGAGAGAVVSFCGIARPETASGDPVGELHLDHYPGMTERSLQAIVEAGAQRFEVGHALVVHRCGTILPGEVIVFVAAASPHRRAAFNAADYLMDRLKTEAVFWKRERGPGGTRWIEPSDGDRADQARWRD
ncbi:MAG: molybdenum cofactor biosynthesis protein MoaE [Alphaproteobacteria bacterium]|nr:molybdenum cofactor biosynthesis protein MoaE [Alphaproteobacteria bacterium]